MLILNENNNQTIRAPYKVFPLLSILSAVLYENISGPSLELPEQDSSNEGPHLIFFFTFFFTKHYRKNETFFGALQKAKKIYSIFSQSHVILLKD